MSTSPAQSSLCLISSHELPSPLPPRIARRPFVHEHPRAFQLVAVERELEVALLQRRVDVVGLRRPRALVPQHDDAGAVAFRDHALERAVLDRDDPRRASRAAWSSGSSDGPWAPPTTAARRCIRGGSRSAGGWPGASARRRTGRRAASSSRARSPAYVAGRLGRAREVALLACTFRAPWSPPERERLVHHQPLRLA